MNLKKSSITAVVISGILSLGSAVPVYSRAEDNTHTVTVLDFDGNVMTTLNVSDGESLNLDSVDISSLKKHLDIYTQIGFSSWAYVPETVTEDVTVQALYRKMTIALESVPDKYEYYDNFGEISLKGLKVTITSETQFINESGEKDVNTAVTDISEYCTVSPENLSQAFAESNISEVKVFPIGSTKPILTYDIKYYSYLGDSNMDGEIDATDASLILQMYSEISTGRGYSFEAGQKKRCDVDGDGNISAVDATFVLRYYAEAATSFNPSWESILS